MPSRNYPHRITFRGPTETVEDRGQVKRTYDDGFSRWAKVQKTGGGQAEQNDQQRRTANFEINLRRYDTDIGTINPDTWQIRWHLTGQILNIDEIAIDRSSRTWLVTITATLDS